MYISEYRIQGSCYFDCEDRIQRNNNYTFHDVPSTELYVKFTSYRKENR